MAILAGLASILGRFAGRLLNTTLGWATVLLFGKVPQQKQTLLLLIVLGSLGWVALVIGVLLPDVGALLIAAVPLPGFVSENWVRLGMLVGALLLPLGVGAAAIFVTAEEQRPRGGALLQALLRGYPFTLVLAMTIVILAAVATVRKLGALSRRWEDTHVPIIVKPGAYEQVLGELRSVLEAAGFNLRVEGAPRVVSAPPKLLDWAAGGLGALVPDRLMVIRAQDLETLVYPSDLAISGSRQKVAEARAAVVSRLAHAPAYMTTSQEAQEFEDDLERLSRAVRQGNADAAGTSLADLDRRLATLVVPFDEWETLHRERLQLERDMLRRSLPGLASSSAAESEVTRERPAGARGARPSLAAVGVAAVGLALLLVDVILLLADRRTRRRRR